MSNTSTDPREVHALAGKILEFLSSDTAASLELQTGALQIAASALQEAVRINSAQNMQNEVRNFWRKRP